MAEIMVKREDFSSWIGDEDADLCLRIHVLGCNWRTAASGECDKGGGCKDMRLHRKLFCKLSDLARGCKDSSGSHSFKRKHPGDEPLKHHMDFQLDELKGSCTPGDVELAVRVMHSHSVDPACTAPQLVRALIQAEALAATGCTIAALCTALSDRKADAQELLLVVNLVFGVVQQGTRRHGTMSGFMGQLRMALGQLTASSDITMLEGEAVLAWLASLSSKPAMEGNAMRQQLLTDPVLCDHVVAALRDFDPSEFGVIDGSNHHLLKAIYGGAASAAMAPAADQPDGDAAIFGEAAVVADPPVHRDAAEAADEREALMSIMSRLPPELEAAMEPHLLHLFGDVPSMLKGAIQSALQFDWDRTALCRFAYLPFAVVAHWVRLDGLLVHSENDVALVLLLLLDRWSPERRITVEEERRRQHWRQYNGGCRDWATVHRRIKLLYSSIRVDLLTTQYQVADIPEELGLPAYLPGQPQRLSMNKQRPAGDVMLYGIFPEAPETVTGRWRRGVVAARGSSDLYLSGFVLTLLAQRVADGGLYVGVKLSYDRAHFPATCNRHRRLMSGATVQCSFELVGVGEAHGFIKQSNRNGKGTLWVPCNDMKGGDLVHVIIKQLDDFSDWRLQVRQRMHLLVWELYGEGGMGGRRAEGCCLHVR